ncbi:STAS domain-containing protein [Streptomyces sp. NPDC048224]|uniref:STAS domain-containing protein n=1 Tax=Streptomyces sp. NPDC048224 TaxID=3154500 RepID=UPI0033FC930C
MNVTTTIDGTRASLTPHGDIDFDTLSSLRAAVDALPDHVTDLLWDLHHTPFMDVAGLHLLFGPAPRGGVDRTTTVTGLRPQALRMLLLATDVHPTVIDISRLFPDTLRTLPA